jgi:hypothetical protein
MKDFALKKPMKIRQCIVLAALVLTTALRASDDFPNRTVDINYTFDDRGDALVEVSFQHTAARWNQWKEAFGDHPDLLLRNLRYQFASAALEDFKFEKDDIHRRAVSKIKACALARYRGGGNFTIHVPKDMKLVSGSGTDWAFTATKMTEGEILTTTVRAKLPAKAINPHYGPGGDFDELSYSMSMAPARSPYLLAAGIFLLLLGIMAAAVSFVLGPKTTTVTIFSPPPMPPMPPQGKPPLPNTPA